MNKAAILLFAPKRLCVSLAIEGLFVKIDVVGELLGEHHKNLGLNRLIVCNKSQMKA